MFWFDQQAEASLLLAESVLFLCFTPLKMAQVAWDDANATAAFESLSFLFAGFLGFAALARAAH
ncbi:MAG: hypothetical protein E5X69_16110 [Mesorhizobium sp.]|nr:MAG: hypothetical protein E5X69_16110 [Mesorhizobium sp.]